MGAGYDIGLSASTANATPQSQSAATVFNFNSAGTSFDGGTTSAYGPATAVATTKSPGSSQAVSPDPYNPNDRNPATNPLYSAVNQVLNPGNLAIGVVIIAAIVGGLWAYNRFVKP